jgi:DNA modification methylase
VLSRWNCHGGIVGDEMSLPTPYYDEDGITIYHGDCREILPHLPKVDLVLTDPPYGLADRWTGGTWGAAPMYEDAKRWDRDIPIDAVIAMMSLGTNSIIWGGNLYPLPPSRCWLSWEKSSKMSTLADFELAWTSFDRPSKQWLEDRNPDGKREHPTQKPLSLFLWCLGFAPDASTILDPFMGSGTTLRAAKDLGRRCIGIEIEERYCEIAVKRLGQEVLRF